MLGLVSIAFALVFLWKSKSLYSNGIKTKAEVIQLLKKFKSKPGNSTPVFRYYDQNGKEFTKENPVATSPSFYTVGDVVDVVYNPQKPEESKVISFWGLFRWTILLAIFGLALIIMGGGYKLFRMYFAV